MKKTLLLGVLAVISCDVAMAQISTGGLPLRLTSRDAAANGQFVSPVYYKAPDLKTFLEEDQKDVSEGPAPYRCGKIFTMDLSFPQSGSLVTLADGRKIWRAQVNAGEVPALLFYYDHFSLPNGVKYYITNANDKQILGAYTAVNNPDDGLFATQEVQGGVVNFELDIDKEVDLSAIQWHINQGAALFRSVEYLNRFAGNSDVAQPLTDWLAGSSSVCEVNAICPQGVNYPNQRKSVARIISPLGNGYVGLCSGTLVNNTSANCAPYFLTASHCQESNSKVSSTYSQWVFYFNFESPDCAGTQEAPNTQTMTGADFIARSNYNANSTAIIGDFLLLKLKQKVPASYNAYLAGWNRAATLPASGSTYIGFHHPAGDIKKLSMSSSISATGTFNQSSTPATHWKTTFTVGGIEGGSSGSGYFDVNGRLVGDLSGAPDIQACAAGVDGNGDPKTMNKSGVLYSKFTRNWQYPEGNGASNAQLKIWLDPNNTGVVTTNALAAGSCTGTINDAITGINNNSAFEQSISIFPNPVISGVLRLRANMTKSADLTITIYDINGAAKATYRVTGVQNGEYTFDMSGYANGAYLVHISDGSSAISKKVMLAH